MTSYHLQISCEVIILVADRQTVSANEVWRIQRRGLRLRPPGAHPELRESIGERDKQQKKTAGEEKALPPHSLGRTTALAASGDNNHLLRRAVAKSRTCERS